MFNLFKNLFQNTVHIKELINRVEKLERKNQIKETGMLKVYSPVVRPPKRHYRRPRLTAQEVSQVETDLLNGWKTRDIMRKYGCSDATVWRIRAGKQAKQSPVVQK